MTFYLDVYEYLFSLPQLVFKSQQINKQIAKRCQTAYIHHILRVLPTQKEFDKYAIVACSFAILYEHPNERTITMKLHDPNGYRWLSTCETMNDMYYSLQQKSYIGDYDCLIQSYHDEYTINYDLFTKYNIVKNRLVKYPINKKEIFQKLLQIEVEKYDLDRSDHFVQWYHILWILYHVMKDRKNIYNDRIFVRLDKDSTGKYQIDRDDWTKLKNQFDQIESNLRTEIVSV